jgi:hypothetical protein
MRFKLDFLRVECEIMEIFWFDWKLILPKLKLDFQEPLDWIRNSSYLMFLTQMAQSIIHKS